MKYLSLIIILFLFARCNNATDESIQKSDQDSATAEKISLRLVAQPEEVITLAAATTEVTKIIQANKDTMWVIVSSDCSQTIFENHPFQVAPPPPTNNVKPVIKTGPDQITSGTTVTLNGSGSTDPDGTIVKFVWTQEKGNPAILVTVGAVCNVSGLLAGDYRFRLTITDNSGGTNSDTIHVKKTGSVTPPPPGNQTPVVNAGASQSITLPINSVELSGSAADPDGTVTAYLWSKVSGTGSTITTPSNPTTTVTGLTAGTYVFNLKATDNAGGIGNKTTTVTVNSATPPPPTGYTLTFSTGYDTQADMLFGGNGQYGNGTISTSTYKTGPGSFYSRPQNVSNGIRSEVQYGGSEQNNTEGAITWDVMYEVLIPNNGHSFQFHPNTGGGSASPGLWMSGGKFEWNNWINGGNQNHPTGVTIQTGKWYSMRIEYKFASNGYFRHYIDGVLACSWTGQVGDGSGQYLKVGYNGWDGSSTSSRIYYDNLKIYKK